MEKTRNFIFRVKGFTKRKLEFFNIYKKLSRKYIQEINRTEYFNPPFNEKNERPVEYGFVFAQLSELYPQKILDVGTGVTALPHLMANCGLHVTATDNVKDYWRKDMLNRHFYIINDDITNTKLKDSFDLITCISTLEHIENYNQAVNTMFDLLNPGGHLILTFPYTEHRFVDNVYILPGSQVGRLLSFKTHSYSRNELEAWIKKNKAIIVKQEYWQFFTGDTWTVGEQLPIPKKVTKGDLHQISCILFKKN